MHPHASFNHLLFRYVRELSELLQNDIPNVIVSLIKFRSGFRIFLCVLLSFHTQLNIVLNMVASFLSKLESRIIQNLFESLLLFVVGFEHPFCGVVI